MTSTYVDQCLDLKVLLITHTTAVGLYSLPWNLESSRPIMFSCCKSIETVEKFFKQVSVFFHAELAEAHSDFCNLDEEVGPCMAYLRRFFFDRHEGKCKEFIYGGCSGNKNNFRTLGECQSTCGGKETLRWNCKSQRSIDVSAGY